MAEWTMAGLAAEIGLGGPSMLQKVFSGIRHLSPEKAVAAEKATGGQLKFEELVRPEVAGAFRELADIRGMVWLDGIVGGGR